MNLIKLNTLKTALLPFIAITLFFFSGQLLAGEHKTNDASSQLTKEQLATFKELRQEARPNRDEFKELHQQMHDLIFSDGYSDKKAQEMIRIQQEKMLNQMVKNAHAMHDFYTGLNPEQRKKLSVMCKEDKKHKSLDDKKQCKGKHDKDDDEDSLLDE